MLPIEQRPHNLKWLQEINESTDTEYLTVLGQGMVLALEGIHHPLMREDCAWAIKQVQRRLVELT